MAGAYVWRRVGAGTPDNKWQAGAERCDDVRGAEQKRNHLTVEGTLATTHWLHRYSCDQDEWLQCYRCGQEGGYMLQLWPERVATLLQLWPGQVATLLQLWPGRVATLLQMWPGRVATQLQLWPGRVATQLQLWPGGWLHCYSYGQDEWLHNYSCGQDQWLHCYRCSQEGGYIATAVSVAPSFHQPWTQVVVPRCHQHTNGKNKNICWIKVTPFVLWTQVINVNTYSKQEASQQESGERRASQKASQQEIDVSQETKASQ